MARRRTAFAKSVNSTGDAAAHAIVVLGDEGCDTRALSFATRDASSPSVQLRRAARDANALVRIGAIQPRSVRNVTEYRRVATGGMWCSKALRASPFMR